MSLFMITYACPYNTPLLLGRWKWVTSRRTAIRTLRAKALKMPSILWCSFSPSAFMFKYSERPGTFAQRNLGDDIPEDVKTARLTEIINLQNKLSEASNKRDVGKEFEVLVEGTSKRSEEQLFGRTSQNKMVVFDRGDHQIGDYVKVRITGCSSATLFGEEVK